jgi:hypothetical protein
MVAVLAYGAHSAGDQRLEPAQKKDRRTPNFCPGDTTNTFANCFSFACVRAGKINGVEVATCFCPIAESLTGTGVPLGTSFGTQAGQGNEDICSQLPVGAPFPRPIPISLQLSAGFAGAVSSANVADPAIPRSCRRPR